MTTHPDEVEKGSKEWTDEDDGFREALVALFNPVECSGGTESILDSSDEDFELLIYALLEDPEEQTDDDILGSLAALFVNGGDHSDQCEVDHENSILEALAALYDRGEQLTASAVAEVTREAKGKRSLFFTWSN